MIRSDFASRFLPRHVKAEKIGDGPPFREDHSNIGRGPIFWGGHGHGGMAEAKSTCPTPGVTRRPNPCLLRAESMSGLDGNQEVWGGLQPLYLLFFTLGSLWDHFAPGVPHQGNGSHGRRATVLNAVGVRGQGGNREVGGGLRCWWADCLE